MTAAMAPGVNSYVFASMYSRGQAQAASAVLLATALLVLTASVWLAILGGVWPRTSPSALKSIASRCAVLSSRGRRR